MKKFMITLIKTVMLASFSISLRLGFLISKTDLKAILNSLNGNEDEKI